MLVTGASHGEIDAALTKINKSYAGNLRFARFVPRPNGFLVRLGVSDCRSPGARRGFSRNKDGERRRSASACWHAPGDFIDALPPLAGVHSAPLTHLVTRHDYPKIEHGGSCRWIDWQVGSMADPAYMSQLCDCDNHVGMRHVRGRYGRGLCA